MPRHRQTQRRRLRADLKTAVDADQAELAAVTHGSANVEAGIADDQTAGTIDDSTVPWPVEMASWADTDMRYDDAAGSIAEEFIRRRRSMGDAYPFSLNGNSLIYQQSKTLVYEFCLAICMSTSLSRRPYNRLPPAFERLSRDVLKCFLGPGSDGYRTGWPRDRFRDRPVRFKAVVEELNRQTGEWVWSPAPGRSDNPSHTAVKDEGLDVVVWKRIGDDRRGHLFLLGQCACGQDWAEKLYEVDIGFLQNTWVRRLSVAPPMRVFATPHHIANREYFDEVNGKAGLTLDRARIALLAERKENRAVVLGGAKDPLADLIRLVIPDFVAGQQAA